MAIQRSIPMQRIVSGRPIDTSEICFVTDESYTSKGEALIITKTLDMITIRLDSRTTDHIIIKSLTKTKILPINALIDEEYSEMNIGKGASVELYFSFGNWYVVSSDGIKEEGLY
jgi:hypothetical protein